MIVGHTISTTTRVPVLRTSINLVGILSGLVPSKPIKSIGGNILATEIPPPGVLDLSELEFASLVGSIIFTH